jgi:hypothetical protein
MTSLISARAIQDIERDQHEMSQKFDKPKDGQLIDLISNIGGKAKTDYRLCQYRNLIALRSGALNNGDD